MREARSFKFSGFRPIPKQSVIIGPTAVSGEDNTEGRRWHKDQRSSVTNAFNELEKVKPEYQQIIGTIMLKVAEHMRDKKRDWERRNKRGLKELGHDKIVGLMKSQNRRRWYDQDRVLHKVYQYLYILEQHGDPVLSNAMGRAVAYVKIYSDYCKDQSRPESIEEVTKLISQVLYEGAEAGEKFMNALEIDIQEEEGNVFMKPKNAGNDREEAIEDEETGMRVEQS